MKERRNRESYVRKYSIANKESKRMRAKSNEESYVRKYRV